MKFKVIIFSIMLFVAHFLATTIYISSSAAFVNEIGAGNISKVIILSALSLPIATFFIQKALKFFKKYEYIFIIYVLSFMTGLFGVYKLYTLGYSSKAFWLFFILGYTGYTMSKLVSWSLLGRYFNVFDSKKIFPVFTAFQEMGSIASALIIKKVLYASQITAFIKLSIIPVVALLFITGIIFIKGIKTLDFKKYEIQKSAPTKKKKKQNIFRFTFSHKTFVFISLLFIITIIFEQSLLYELNVTLGHYFNSTARINEVLSVYKLCESSLVIFANLFLAGFLTRTLTVGNILMIYTSVMAVAVFILNITSFWLIVMAVTLTRHVSKYFLFMPSYERALNSMDSKIRLRLKSSIEGFFAPTCTIGVGFLLMLFPTFDSFKWFNIFLVLIAAIGIYAAIKFKKYYIKYHSKKILSSNKDLVIKSVQALGEHKNYLAVQPLLSLLKTEPRKSIRKNIIASLGQIRAENLLKVLFKEMEQEHEEIQVATLKSLSKFDSFLVQRFLINLIHGNKCQSLNVRMNLLNILQKMLGNAIVPILIPYLEDSNPRIVANTIEAMSPVNDKRIIEVLSPYLEHKNSRVKGNTVITLYKYNELNKACKETLERMAESELEADHNTFIYVIGRLKLKSFKKTLKKFYDIEKNNYKINLALTLSQLEDKKGYDIFSDIFISEDEELIKNSLHHFTQLENAIRLRTLELYINKVESDKAKYSFINLLKESPFDFHEERNFLKSN